MGRHLESGVRRYCRNNHAVKCGLKGVQSGILPPLADPFNFSFSSIRIHIRVHLLFYLSFYPFRINSTLSLILDISLIFICFITYTWISADVVRFWFRIFFKISKDLQDVICIGKYVSFERSNIIKFCFYNEINFLNWLLVLCSIA